MGQQVPGQAISRQEGILRLLLLMGEVHAATGAAAQPSWGWILPGMQAGVGLEQDLGFSPLGSLNIMGHSNHSSVVGHQEREEHQPYPGILPSSPEVLSLHCGSGVRGLW